ncbi:unnamed protein product, partial [Hapterophycus canaliculatus]
SAAAAASRSAAAGAPPHAASRTRATTTATTTPRTPSASSGPSTAAAAAAAATATVVLSSCSFRPAAPQSNPAVPWADGSSETTVSPFLFVLDGGTVEVVAPTFESAGQAFVAQVNPRGPSGAEGGGDTAHLRIVGGDGGSGDRSKDRSARHTVDARLAVVSVGGRVSLVDLDAVGGGGGLDPEEGGGAKTVETVAFAPPPPLAAPFALKELVLLRGELFLQSGGGDGSGQQQQHPGVTVQKSARFRTANVSVVAHDFLAGGAAEAAETAGGETLNGSDSTVVVEVAGRATLGEAWEPKPFFLGTSLSRLFPSSSPAPPRRKVSPAAAASGPRDGSDDRRASKAGGDGDPDDRVSFDGVAMGLKGESVVRGDVSLVGTAGVQVCQTGSLTLAGDTAIRRAQAPPPASLVSSPPPPALRNAGLLVFPRGFSLTVAGGVEQGPSGESVVTLPAPLYAPSPISPSAGCSSQQPSSNDGRWGEAPGARGSSSGGGYPLVVESGSTTLAGSLNASVSPGGGESERRMSRRWPIARFASRGAANSVDTG